MRCKIENYAVRFAARFFVVVEMPEDHAEYKLREIIHIIIYYEGFLVADACWRKKMQIILHVEAPDG